jgi:HEPN domain-containing protein
MPTEVQLGWLHMIDIAKQIQFWRQGAQEDWQVARELVERGHTRHGLFFAHLAYEKVLKALVVVQTNDLAPRLHNLVRLAELAKLDLSSSHLDLLAELNAYNLEGRYPDTFSVPPTPAEARKLLDRTGEVFEWLMSRL